MDKGVLLKAERLFCVCQGHHAAGMQIAARRKEKRDKYV